MEQELKNGNQELSRSQKNGLTSLNWPSDVPSFLILKVASVRFKTHFLKYSSCPILNISGQALLSKSPDVATLVNEGRPQ